MNNSNHGPVTLTPALATDSEYPRSPTGIIPVPSLPVDENGTCHPHIVPYTANDNLSTLFSGLQVTEGPEQEDGIIHIPLPIVEETRRTRRYRYQYRRLAKWLDRCKKERENRKGTIGIRKLTVGPSKTIKKEARKKRAKKNAAPSENYHRKCDGEKMAAVLRKIEKNLVISHQT